MGRTAYLRVSGCRLLPAGRGSGGLDAERRPRAGRAGQPQLLLRLVHAAEPEQAETEMERDTLVLRIAASERAEPRERECRVGLVEPRDGDCDLRLGVGGRQRGCRLVLVERRDLPAEPLAAQRRREACLVLRRSARGARGTRAASAARGARSRAGPGSSARSSAGRAGSSGAAGRLRGPRRACPAARGGRRARRSWRQDRHRARRGPARSSAGRASCAKRPAASERSAANPSGQTAKAAPTSASSEW